MPALSLLLIGRLLVREHLRFLLMAAQEFRCILGMTVLDLLPLTVVLGFTCSFRSGLLALLHFLQMSTLEILRFRVILSLKLLHLHVAVAVGLLLLLDATALKLLQLHVVLALEGLVLLAMLARYRLAHRVVPLGMMLQCPSGIFLRPPVEVVPDVLVVVVALPFGMMLVCPGGIMIVPPGVGVPCVFVVEVTPPVGMILARPVGMILLYPIAAELPPPSGGIPNALVEVAPPFRVMLFDPVELRISPPCGIVPNVAGVVITPCRRGRKRGRPWLVLCECGRRQHQQNRYRCCRQQTLESGHRCHPGNNSQVDRIASQSTSANHYLCICYGSRQPPDANQARRARTDNTEA